MELKEFEKLSEKATLKDIVNITVRIEDYILLLNMGDRDRAKWIRKRNGEQFTALQLRIIAHNT